MRMQGDHDWSEAIVLVLQFFIALVLTWATIMFILWAAYTFVVEPMLFPIRSVPIVQYRMLTQPDDSIRLRGTIRCIDQTCEVIP
jgi:hypothetical protein